MPSVSGKRESVVLTATLENSSVVGAGMYDKGSASYINKQTGKYDACIESDIGFNLSVISRYTIR